MRLLFRAILSVVLVFGWSAEGLADGEQPYLKGANCDDSRIKQSPEMLKALRILKQKLGRTPQLSSCFRDQKYQAKVARRFPGRASKKVSQHIGGVAADLKIGGSDRSICATLDSVRRAIGHGGIGTYGDGSAHLDVRPGLASWAGCGGYETTEYKSKVVEDYIKTVAAEASNNG
jgi:hypothetical protein